MNSAVNLKNTIVHIMLTCVSTTLLFVCIPNHAYSADVDGAPTAMMSSVWISNVYHDANENEKFAILHVFQFEQTEFSLIEYVRTQGLKDNPDIWTVTRSIKGHVGDEMTLSIGSRKLTVEFENDEIKWPIEYHRHSDRFIQPDHDTAEVLLEQTDAMGQWMSYSVDSEMGDPLIWALSITQNKTFSLRMYSYGQQAAPDGWSLMLELVGDVRFDPGVLDAKRVYNVPTGNLERWRGETPLLTQNIELFYNQRDDALTIVFPADGKENRPNMVLVLHSAHKGR